jgi:hypothetical protein
MRGGDGMCRGWEIGWSGTGERHGRGLGWLDAAVRNPR